MAPSKLEELAQLFAGQGVQKQIAADNPYYGFQSVPDSIIGQILPQAAATGKYGLGELAATSLISGLLSGGLNAAGNDYQAEQTDKYYNTMNALKSMVPGKEENTYGLSPSLFTTAKDSRRLFDLQRDLQQEQAQLDLANDIEKAELLKQVDVDAARAIEKNKLLGQQDAEGARPNITGIPGLPKELEKPVLEELGTKDKIASMKEYVAKQFADAEKSLGMGAMIGATGFPTESGQALKGIGVNLSLQYDSVLGREVNDKTRAELKANAPQWYDNASKLKAKYIRTQEILEELAKQTPTLNRLEQQGLLPNTSGQQVPVVKPPVDPSVAAAEIARRIELRKQQKQGEQ